MLLHHRIPYLDLGFGMQRNAQIILGIMFFSQGYNVLLSAFVLQIILFEFYNCNFTSSSIFLLLLQLLNITLPLLIFSPLELFFLIVYEIRAQDSYICTEIQLNVCSDFYGPENV